MTDKTSLSEALLRLNENQIALGAAIEEVARWVGYSGSQDVVDNARLCLSMLDINHVTITDGILGLSDT